MTVVFSYVGLDFVNKLSMCSDILFREMGRFQEIDSHHHFRSECYFKKYLYIKVAKSGYKML